jgi:antitoxin ParD1/3/4
MREMYLWCCPIADRYNDRYPKSVLTMNVILAIPEELQTYIDAQIQSGAYASAVDYFLDLVQQDRQRKQAQAKLEGLLQEGLDSEGEPVTAAYWQNLRASLLGGDS